MAGSGQPYIDYYFRREGLSYDGGEDAHARIVRDLTAAKAGGLLSDFKVMGEQNLRGVAHDDAPPASRLR